MEKKNAINVFNFSIIFVSVLKIGGHFLKKKKKDYRYSIMFSTNQEMQPFLLSPVLEEAGNKEEETVQLRPSFVLFLLPSLEHP